MINNILFLAYEIWFYLLLIASIKILLMCISRVFPYTTKNKLKYVVDRGILWKSEVALGQQKSAQACITPYFYYLITENIIVFLEKFDFTIKSTVCGTRLKFHGTLKRRGTPMGKPCLTLWQVSISA
jgi:hypothetical protein